MAKSNTVGATKAPEGAQFEVVEPEPIWDVAMGYALLSDGTIPPVIRGDDLEDS
jgi:hypothetical protein